MEFNKMNFSLNPFNFPKDPNMYPKRQNMFNIENKTTVKNKFVLQNNETFFQHPNKKPQIQNTNQIDLNDPISFHNNKKCKFTNNNYNQGNLFKYSNHKMENFGNDYFVLEEKLKNKNLKLNEKNCINFQRNWQEQSYYFEPYFCRFQPIFKPKLNSENYEESRVYNSFSLQSNDRQGKVFNPITNNNVQIYNVIQTSPVNPINQKKRKSNLEISLMGKKTYLEKKFKKIQNSLKKINTQKEEEFESVDELNDKKENLIIPIANKKNLSLDFKIKLSLKNSSLKQNNFDDIKKEFINLIKFFQTKHSSMIDISVNNSIIKKVSNLKNKCNEMMEYGV